MALTVYGNRPNSFQWFPSLFSNIVWDPVEVVDQDPLNSFASQGARALAGTKVDWVETLEAHVFKVDLPGLNKEDVKVHVEDYRTLLITGERRKEEVKEGYTLHTVERSYGKFIRRFRLPENVNVDAVSATVTDGVLTVTVPKDETKKPETKSINVN